MINTQILIVGAGPAGMSAAIEAASHGAQTTLIDENDRPGGQLIKQTHAFFGSREHYAGTRGVDIAEILAAKISELGVNFLPRTFAVGLFSEGVLGAARNGEFFPIKAQKIIIATGATENMLAIPNCDLPGVYGAGAVQTLVNVYGIKPGKNVLMVGAGNIGLIVSYQLIQAGMNVIAVLEATSRIGGYDVHAAKLRRLAVPILLNHTIKAIIGKEHVEGAIIVELDNFKEITGTEFAVDCDVVCLAVGLSPLSEILWNAGCKMEFVSALGGYVAWHDERLRTSHPDIYVAGDVSGIEEASAAMIEGRLAALSAIEDLGIKTSRDLSPDITRYQEMLSALRKGPFGQKVRLGKAELFSRAVSRHNLTEEQLSRTQIAEITWSQDSDSRIPDSSHAHSQAKDSSNSNTSQTKSQRHASISDNALSVPIPRKPLPTVIIECYEKIPCDPCALHCKRKAITIEGPMINLPQFHPERCTACGDCLHICPGLCIFMIDKNRSDGLAEVTIPYEFIPLPKEGDTVWAVDRDGRFVTMAEISRIRNPRKFDRTALVSLLVPLEHADTIRHFFIDIPLQRLVRKPVAPDVIPDDVVVCRCEDVTLREIEKGIDEGLSTFDELKRIIRVGMGSCQGKNCTSLILQILARKLGGKPSDYAPGTFRTPLKPIPIGILARGVRHIRDLPR